MPANFDLSNLALKALAPNNEILYDDKGLPSIMVKIPKMTYAQLGLGASTAVHPAFIVNGQEVDAIYISKYQNIVVDGRAYSLPGEEPKHTINFDSAISACTAKGVGWHLMTRAEWAAIALWCKANGTMPKGNNNYGKDTSETVYRAIPMAKDGSNRTTRVATGTGPLAWSHDGTPSGIWDLNGNVNEWVGGIRTVYGELQILANNNAADKDKSQGASSAQWMAVKASDGTLITPSGDGRTTGSIRLTWGSSIWTWTDDAPAEDTTYHGCDFEAIACSANISNDAKALLQALGLFKYDATVGAYAGDKFYADVTQAERSFCCGGNWDFAGAAGVFYSVGTSGRTFASVILGFRAAFVELPSA